MANHELEAYTQHIDRNRLDYIERQRQLFEAAKPALLERYLGEYVAFEDGQILDHDLNRQHLAARIYNQYGYRDLLMRKVTEDEPIYTVGGFQRAD
jgi:hypothetical protein